jgi:hypothetical protein
MRGTLTPHRLKYPRWCDQCKHPSIGQYVKARYIWHQPAGPDVYLCARHAGDIRLLE